MNATYSKHNDYSTPDLRDREPRQDRAFELIEDKRADFRRLEQISCQIQYREKKNLTSTLLSEFYEASNLFAKSLLAISTMWLSIDKDSGVDSQRAKIEKSLDSEIQMWMNSDLSRMDELEPYDWGESDPETIGEPIDW